MMTGDNPDPGHFGDHMSINMRGFDGVAGAFVYSNGPISGALPLKEIPTSTPASTSLPSWVGFRKLGSGSPPSSK
jgi:hypothetical protein